MQRTRPLAAAVRPLLAVFPGQGAQRPGMAKDLWAQHASARAAIEEVEEAVRRNLRRPMFDGDADALADTTVTQPALLAHSAAVVAVLRELTGGALFGAPAAAAAGAAASPDGGGLPVRLVGVAGHSVGEYPALVAAGAVGLGDAAALLGARAGAMAAAAGAFRAGTGLPTAMRALLLGAPPADDPWHARLAAGLAELCAASLPEAACDVVLPAPRCPATGAPRGVRVTRCAGVAAHNSPAQVVVSGAAPALDALLAAARERWPGAVRRALPLPVSAPFHSPIMAPAADVLRAALLAVADGGGGGAAGGAADGAGWRAVSLPPSGAGSGGEAPPPAPPRVALARPAVPLVANATASPLEDPAAIARALVGGVTAPVRWLECVHAALRLAGGEGGGAGAGDPAPATAPPAPAPLVLELGCGSTLTGLVRQCAPGAGAAPEAAAVGTAEEVAALMRRLEGRAA